MPFIDGGFGRSLLACSQRLEIFSLSWSVESRKIQGGSGTQTLFGQGVGTVECCQNSFQYK